MHRSIVALALLALFAVVAGFPAAPSAAREVHDPVLLVHGFNGSGASWHTMEQRLRAAGYPVTSVDAISYDSAESNVAVARQIAGEVDAFVSLAGANRGTNWAVGCAVLVSCREMVPGSPLPRRLSPEVRSDLPTRLAAWGSPCDPAIIPHANAELPGARNTETGCIGHSDLKTDARVASQVLRFIARPYAPTA
jgi:triacylglycerol lipase